MAAQVYPIGVGMFAPMVTVPMAGEAQGVADMAAPQLVMLANVALTSEGAGCECLAEEKQMVELKTVGTYSDSEDESLARYGGYEGEAGTPVGLYPEPQPVQLAQPSPQHPEEARIVTAPALEEDACGQQGAASPPERAPSPAGMAKRRRLQRSAEPPKKKKPFHCKPCQYQAECEEEFIHHIRRHSAKKLIVVGGADGGEEPAQEASAASEGGDGLVYAKGVIRCERCGYNTNRYDHYVAHLKHHTQEGDSQRVYKCTICTYTTVSQYHWKKHLRNHFPSKLYTCSQCCYFSDRKNNYVQHIRTHTGERPFRCPYCKYSSSQKTHLTRHMRTHSGERPFKCETCSYLAANQHEVTRHARQVHNGPKPLSCPHCQYKTADRSNYKKHVELHINPRQFLCPVCTYAASKKCNLQYHIKSRHRDCADITMDVSKVKLRVKKPDSGSTYYKVDGDTQYVLTGIKDQKGQVEKKVTKQASGTTDKQRESSPINLSTKKASKLAGSPPLEKERKDKAPKRGDQAMEKATVEEKGAEKQTSQRADKVERREKSSGRTEKSRGERAEQEGKRCEGGPERVEKKREKEARKPGRASKTAENSEGKAPPKRGRKPGKSPVRAGEKERAEKVEEENRATSERMEKERAEKERADKERVEKERMEKEKVEKERMEKERAEKERMEKERVEKERAEKERVEKERAEKERMEKERAEKERVEKERVEKEKVEKQRAETKNRKTVKSVKRSYQKLAKVMKEPVDTDQGTTEESQKGSENSERREGSAVGKRKVPEVELPEQDPTASEQLPVSRKSKRKKEEEKPPQGGGLLRRGRKPKATCQASRSTPAKGLDGPAAAQLQTRSKKGPGKRKQSSGPVESGARDGHAECSPVDNSPKQPLNGDSLSEVLAKPQASNPRSSVETGDGQVGEAEGHQEGRTATARAEPSRPPKTRDASRQRAEPSCPLSLPGTAHKPADTEEDEGIHSHEGSDISDDVSEGSDDSGLSGSGKLAGPETPTEGPAPALAPPSSHTCIFCDRTFPMEAEYRRHLNRHLVNVYYLESAAAEDEH